MTMQPPPPHVKEISLPPAFWGMLLQDEKTEFLRLRANFHQNQRVSSKDRRIVTFRKELLVVLNYLETKEENMEARSILCGVCFAGPYVCVNTRQLKNFLGRCKSSINGSFQQLGFVALRTKIKSRNIIITVLPSLQTDQTILRQWTVRCVSDNSQFCFVSSFSRLPLPKVTNDDLFDDKVTPTQKRNLSEDLSDRKKISFELPQMSEAIRDDFGDAKLRTSFSVGSLHSLYSDISESVPDLADSPQEKDELSSIMTRSLSSSFKGSETFQFLDDGFNIN